MTKTDLQRPICAQADGAEDYEEPRQPGHDAVRALRDVGDAVNGAGRGVLGGREQDRALPAQTSPRLLTPFRAYPPHHSKCLGTGEELVAWARHLQI